MRRGRVRAVRRQVLEEQAEPDGAAPRPRMPVSNRALLHVVGSGRGGPAPGDGLLEPPAPAPVRPVTVASGAPQVIVLEKELVGHGNGPGTETPEHGTEAAPTGSVGGVEVDVVFRANEPIEEHKPAEDIASGHDQTDAVGWTTPSYSVLARPDATPTRGTVDVTLDFTIELTEEFQGRTLEVVRDHELGHVNLATMAGEAFLSDMLETQLEAQPAVTPAVFESIVRSSAAAFELWEGVFSWVYDRIDYPRMREAYLGARMTLDELTAVSPEVGRMADSLRSFASVGEEDIDSEADGLLAARAALSDLDVARVQYNPEFEELVWGVDEQIAALLATIEEESQGERRLREISSMLSDFTWQAPGT